MTDSLSGSVQSPSDTHPEISAIITCYYEEGTIEEFYSRLSNALDSTGRSYEIIFVNDGSTDRTFEKLKRIFESDPHVSAVIDLFKNAGQAAAITAALSEARGTVLLSMDSDLQLDAAELPILIAEYDKGYDVVSGCRKERKDSLVRIVPSKLANVIMRKASGTNFRDFGCTFKLYNAELVRAFDFGPRNVFNPVTILSKAQRLCEVSVSHSPRKHGKSGWTLKKLWSYQMESIVGLTERPFQYMTLFALLLALLFCLRLLVTYFTPFQILDQVTNGLILNSLIIVFLFLLTVLCAIGEFSIRAFLGLRYVPQYIIRERIRRHGSKVKGAQIVVSRKPNCHG
jgi:glycosyltransferase involved in cell wall biosynthesis